MGTRNHDATRHRDGPILVAWLAVGALVCWMGGPPWIVANVVLLGAPLGILLWRNTDLRRRLPVKFIALFVVFSIVVFDHLAERFQGWAGPASVLPPLPGGVTIEEITWIVFYFPLVIAVDECFFAPRWPRRLASDRVRSFTRRSLKVYFVLGITIALTPLLHSVLRENVYAKVGTMLEFPWIVLGLVVDRSLIRRLLGVGLVAAVYNAIFEAIALRHGYWTFPGEYVGWISVLGLRFPLEELLFLILFSAPSIVAATAIYRAKVNNLVLEGAGSSVQQRSTGR